MRGTTRPTRAPFVVGAIVFGAAFVAIYLLFVTTHLGQVIDERAFVGAANWRGDLVTAARSLLDALPTVSVVLAVVITVIVVLVRRNGTVFVVAAATAFAANASTEILKYTILERPDKGVDQGLSNSLPSGHTTAAASVALAVFLVSSPRMRPLVAVVGALFTMTAGAATLVNQWHRPSDVVAAMVVVGFWGCAAGFVLAGLPAAHSARPYCPRMRWLLWLTVACALAALVGFGITAVGARGTSSHLLVAYLGAVAAIAAVALALAWTGIRFFRWLR